MATCTSDAGDISGMNGKDEHVYSNEGKEKASFDCNKKWKYPVGFAMNGSVVHAINWENHTVYKYSMSGELLENLDPISTLMNEYTTTLLACMYNLDSHINCLLELIFLLDLAGSHNNLRKYMQFLCDYSTLLY